MKPSSTGSCSRRIDVRSKFFDVRGRLRMADRVLVERSLVELVSPTNVIKVLHRERESSLDTGS